MPVDIFGDCTEGSRGPRGRRGPPGLRGNRGPRGFTGPPGSIGPVGPRGNPGPKGNDGEKGKTGIQGPVGNVGPRGNPGPKGNDGEKGETGIQGPVGRVGPRGNPGPKGNDGEKGETGIQGPVGGVGPKGEKGKTGLRGKRGMKGDVGPPGKKGDRGPKGSDAKIQPFISKYLAQVYSECFTTDYIMLWYNTHHLRNFDYSSSYYVTKAYNLTRYKWFADNYPMTFVSGYNKAKLMWNTITGHNVAREDKAHWRYHTSGSSINCYQYYMKFNASKYFTSYPLANINNVCVFVVYRLNGYLDNSALENFLFDSGDSDSRKGICFVPAKYTGTSKRAIRIFGVENGDLGFIDISDWGRLQDPTRTGIWNVICVHWNKRSGHNSSVWLNYGKNYRGGPIHIFNASENNSKQPAMVIGNINDTSAKHYLDGDIVNIELYNTDFLDDYFITARMKTLSEQYDIQDSIFNN